MSASTQPRTTLPETRRFAENCTLEKALEVVVDVYHHYSTQRGHLDLLNFSEFQKLLTEQAPTFLQACNRNSRDYLNKLFKETDLNKDRELTFEEFTIVLAKLTDDAHRISHKSDRCTPDKD